MYDPKSMCADDFIDHQEILDTLAYAEEHKSDAALIGSIIYRVLTGIALTSNLGASNLKLVSAVIVAAAISWPAVRDKILFYKKRKEADKEC